jgi:hypothetical protein
LKEKNTAKKITLFCSKKGCPLSKLQWMPASIKREHPELQKMKFINFLLFFGVIRIQGPHYPDPDSQHCRELILCIIIIIIIYLFQTKENEELTKICDELISRVGQ